MRVAMVHSEGLLAQVTVFLSLRKAVDVEIYYGSKCARTIVGQRHLFSFGSLFRKETERIQVCFVFSIDLKRLVRSTIQEDMNVKNDPEASAREKVAATLLCIEKQILHQSIEALLKLAGVQSTNLSPSPLYKTTFLDSTDLPAVSSEAPVELN